MGVQSIAFQPDERGKKIGCAAATTQNVICKLFKTFLREQTKDDYRMFNFSCSFTETLNGPSIVHINHFLCMDRARDNAVFLYNAESYR